MKFDRSKIMKRAWKLKREKNIEIGQAIKLSWSIEKCLAAKKSLTPVKKQNDFRMAVKSLFNIDLEYSFKSNKERSVA